MSFLSPLSALLAASVAVPALVLLYFLKLRRKQLVISSTLLWKKAIQDMQVNSPFQRLRRNLLLLIQLILLALLLFALARPTVNSRASPGERVVIVIDRSGSMNATDVDVDAGAGTRLDEAKAAALQIVGNLNATGGESGGGGGTGAGAGAMVVTFAENARVVQPFTTDPGLLRSAINRIQPTDQRSQIVPALRLIEPFALEAQSAGADGAGLTVHVLSDGRVHTPEGEALSLPGADLRFVRLGTMVQSPASASGGGDTGANNKSNANSTGNVGFVAFSARRDFDKPQMVQVFARLTNNSPVAREGIVTLVLDGDVQRAQRVTVPGLSEQDEPGTRQVRFDLVVPGPGFVELRHDIDDVLSVDNSARLHLAPPRRLRVLLVTEGNPFTERALASVGVRNVVTMPPGRYEDQDPQRLVRQSWTGVVSAGEEGFDVIVFDGYSPKQVPMVNALYFGSHPPIEGVQLIKTSAGEAGRGPAAEPILDWERGHPVLRYVVLDDVVISEPPRVTVPMDGQVLAVSQRGPIMAEVLRDGVRHVVVSFNVLKSNWPLFVSYPVFISNAVQQLGLGTLADEAGLMYRAGEVAVLPVYADLSTVRFTGPDNLEGRQLGGQTVLPSFPRAGIYEASVSIEPPYERLAVNMLDDLESDTRPVGQLQVGTVAVQGEARSAAIRREIWPWFVLAALGVLMLEWVVYTRRMHV